MLSLLELVRPYFFLQDDNRDDFLPLFVHDWRALRQGTIALFNFHQFLGIPHLAAGQTAVLYPPVYIAVGLSRLLFGHYFAAIDLLVIAQLAAGAMGAYLLLRDLSVSGDAAFFGSVSWGLCPFVVGLCAFWATFAPVASLLPWMLFFSRRVLERGMPVELAALCAARSLLFFSGHAELFLYAVLFEACFALASCQRGRSRGLPRWLASCGLTALLCLPLLLPMLGEVAGSAERAGPISFRAFSHDDAAPAAWLLGVVWPFTTRSGFAAPSSHVGWLGLALAAVAVASRGERWTRAALGLAAVALLWAFGALDHPLYLLPLFDRFRFHFHLLFFAAFALVLLAAKGFDSVRGRPRLLRWAWALQALNLLVVAAATPPGGFITDSQRPPLVEPLAPMLRGGRVASLGRLRPSPARFAPMLGFNYATLWGLDHFAGYDPLVPAGNFVETGQVNEDSLLDRENFDSTMEAKMVDWGVRWIVVDARDRARDESALRFARPRVVDADRVVYEIVGGRPMAYRLNTGEALPVSFGINSARVGSDAPKASEVVLNVYRNAGFVADIDGRLATVEFTPFSKMSVLVPPGRHTVVFRYEEPAFVLGLSLAAAACLAFWLWARRAGRRVS